MLRFLLTCELHVKSVLTSPMRVSQNETVLHTEHRFKKNWAILSEHYRLSDADPDVLEREQPLDRLNRKSLQILC